MKTILFPISLISLVIFTGCAHHPSVSPSTAVVASHISDAQASMQAAAILSSTAITLTNQQKTALQNQNMTLKGQEELLNRIEAKDNVILKYWH